MATVDGTRGVDMNKKQEAAQAICAEVWRLVERERENKRKRDAKARARQLREAKA
jgi:hypothetical protein